MENRNNEYELNGWELTPFVGLPSYFVRIFRDNDLPEIFERKIRVGFNSLALIVYNSTIAFGIDYFVRR